ncbi:hypothetical protein [Actinoplanes derwentensis]|uniref:DUF1877 family protein n=1 Tax=Actinoplanes derwentensis TaxID=113562 RepID=A0A1H1ZRJ4_9ACTN|nr:hypothetical protein [Actinoplanes derwentensis]GID89176.1 hypothetical protein Ade03nite_81000 [Actinoplanes derwentensis]SDT36280.1 hypothetical protein SAMN04489716_3458 [Actinoplanes derwentensis]
MITSRKSLNEGSVRRSRRSRDRCLPAGLGCFADRCRKPRARLTPAQAEELPEITRQLLAVVPAGTGWTPDWFESRNHQQAEYLLDPAGYRALSSWEQREQARAYQTIMGVDRFAEHATSGQGIRWRCSTAAQLAEAARLIDDLDVVAARREYSVADMLEQGVYQVHETEDDAASFARNLRDLRSRAGHCRDLAARGLDLVITLY